MSVVSFSDRKAEIEKWPNSAHIPTIHRTRNVSTCNQDGRHFPYLSFLKNILNTNESLYVRLHS